MSSNNTIPVTFGKCHECGLMHPPLKNGERCPIAMSKNNPPTTPVQQNVNKTSLQQPQQETPQPSSIPQNVQITDINKFLVDLRNIILSQIGIKKIKDPQKLFKNIIIELTKVIENHKD